MTVPQLHRKPLVTNELVGPLCKIDPIYKEEEEAFKVCVCVTHCMTQFLSLASAVGSQLYGLAR